MATLWKARFRDSADELAQQYTASVDLDKHLADQDIRYSKAHVSALAGAGVLTASEATALQAALDQVAEESASGDLPTPAELEDIHTVIENRVTEIAGSTGARLHTGRSRNDQVATDMRLFVVETIDTAVANIQALQAVLVDRAKEHVDTLLPAYSHMQRAQPVSLAHHLLAYFWMLQRDRERLEGARERAALSPAGAAACAGTGIPLDRVAIAASLGFDGVVPNSLDAVSERDFLVEFVATAALCLSHCGRLAADLCLWSTAEFGFCSVPEAYCTGSSMMPQKMNPDTLELVRGRAATVGADLSALLGVLHGLPLGYQRDLQEDKRPMLHAASVLLTTLRLLTPIIAGVRFHTDRMEDAASDPALLATDWAEELVQAGVPFREAYGAVGRLMRRSSGTGEDPRNLPEQQLIEAHPALPEALAAVPDARAAVARKVTQGSTGPDALAVQLADAEALLA